LFKNQQSEKTKLRWGEVNKASKWPNSSQNQTKRNSGQIEGCSYSEFEYLHLAT